MAIVASAKSTATGLISRLRPGKRAGGGTPDYGGLPNVHEWSPGYPTTTLVDPSDNLLTTRTEGVAPIPEGMTVYDLYADRARRLPDAPLFTFKEGGAWHDKTGSEVLTDIRAAAKGLLHAGLRKGDAVALMCHTSYQWNVVDAAVLAVGGVIATVYDTDSAEQIRAIVNNADAKRLIVQTRQMRERADGAVEECPSLQRIDCLENGALAELQAYGESVSDRDLDRRIESVTKHDLCSVVYTSGSTAAPKGVEMTHEHYCTMADNLRAYIPDLVDTPHASLLAFLPQAHSFARAISYGCVFGSVHIYIAQGIATLLADLQYARPTLMIGVPRVFEKVYNAASQKAGHGVKGRMFLAASHAARRYMSEISQRGRANRRTATLRALYDPLIYAPLRQVLGGRIRWIVSGGAPLDPQLLDFFRGARVPVYEGYGLTETTAPCAFNPLGTPYHRGSVGIAFPGFSLRIGRDGGIEVSGVCTFHRYHRIAAATASSFTADGWYVTGDLGRMTHDGFLFITGRKKDLIITAGGKNVSPAPIEEKIQRCRIISKAVVLGDKRPFISALITLDEETLRPWLAEQGLNKHMPVAQAASNAVVRAEVQKYVDMANEGVSRAESVRKFIILPEDFTQKNGLLTASLKVIRPKVLARYAQLLNTRMYVPRR